MQCLILRRGGDVTLNGQMTQERSELRGPHVARVSLAVKEDEAPDPLHVRLLRAEAVMPHAH